MKILMHPKPMLRHTQHVQLAECEATIRLPEAGGATPGLHLALKLEGGATQRVVFPLESLAELERVARMARAGICGPAEAAPFGWYCELVHEQTGEVIRASFFRDAPLEGPDDVAGFVWRATPVAAFANASGGAAA